MIGITQYCIASAVGTLFLVASGCVSQSPGTLYESSTLDLTPAQLDIRQELRSSVEHLSAEIGPRNAAESLRNVVDAERWLLDQLESYGLVPDREVFDMNGPEVANIVVEFTGTERPDETIVIGAHYDTATGSPGANDNASGVAVLLATAKRLQDRPIDRTVRLVFFVNEENPFSFGIQMGSRVHADRSRARNDNIVAMIAIDSLGNYSSEAGSQNYPPMMFGLPKVGNFVAFVSNEDNQRVVDTVLKTFQSESRFPSIGVASDHKIALRSDHASFLWRDYPALMMTDTSEVRDPNYHLATDTAEKLDYDEMARLTEGFVRFVEALALSKTDLN